MKPFNDHTRSIRPELVRDASPLLRRLWGALPQLLLTVSNVPSGSRLPTYPRGSNFGRIAVLSLLHAGFESQLAFEDWHLRRPLNSGRNMKIVAAEGAKPRGPFGTVEQIEWTGLSRL